MLYLLIKLCVNLVSPSLTCTHAQFIEFGNGVIDRALDIANGIDVVSPTTVVS